MKTEFLIVTSTKSLVKVDSSASIQGLAQKSNHGKFGLDLR